MGAVLVINDEKQVLDLLKTALTLHGYRVEVATNGVEGIDKFDRSRYDVVITDVSMPGVDGFGVVHHIRHSGKSSSTPVMGISSTPWDFKDADFDVILKKPVSIRDLVDHVTVLGTRVKHPTR